MAKRKPKIFKADGDGWLIYLPPYGFNTAKVVGPFTSQPEAFQHLTKHRMFSAAASSAREKEASDWSWSRRGHQYYPLRIIS